MQMVLEDLDELRISFTFDKSPTSFLFDDKSDNVVSVSYSYLPHVYADGARRSRWITCLIHIR